MATIFKFGPGLAAALLALFVVRFIAWLGWASWSGEVAIFVIIYLVGSIAIERGVEKYRTKGSGSG